MADILYDSWSPAMTVNSICISILSMLSSATAKVSFKNLNLHRSCLRESTWTLTGTLFLPLLLCDQEMPADNDRYVKNCRKSPKQTSWEFHDDKA